MMRLSEQRSVPTRLLGLDIEAQHGATWGDFDSRIFFGAARRFADEPDGMRYLKPRASAAAFERFIAPLREPGVIVVAHNGRFDLNGLSGEVLRLGLAPLPPLLLSDTLKDSFQSGYMFPRSLSAMVDLLGLEGEKVGFGQYAWEATYRGEAWALERLQRYNENDVDQVLAVRAAMLDRGMLKYHYRTWTP